MPAPRKYHDELRERAVRLALGSQRPIAHVARERLWLPADVEGPASRRRGRRARSGPAADAPRGHTGRQAPRAAVAHHHPRRAGAGPARSGPARLQRAGARPPVGCATSATSGLGGRRVLRLVIDVYSRRIVGWHFAAHMRATLVLDALRMALAQRRASLACLRRARPCRNPGRGAVGAAAADARRLLKPKVGHPSSPCPMMVSPCRYEKGAGG